MDTVHRSGLKGGASAAGQSSKPFDRTNDRINTSFARVDAWKRNPCRGPCAVVANFKGLSKTKYDIESGGTIATGQCRPRNDREKQAPQWV